MPESMPRQYRTRAVYASATPSRAISEAQCRTHTVLVLSSGEFNPICRRVKAESVMEDEGATNPEARPTCPDCLRRDPRFVAELAKEAAR